MKLIYIISIQTYKILTKLVSPFILKAKQRILGLKNQKNKTFNIDENKRIWFHCASLGEFEQGRPLIEKIKKENPETKIILSFFSPSGYEIRKNFSLADEVCYLPFDSRKNAKEFILKYKPDIAIFVKYEFWHFFINELKLNNIPTFLISGIFRKNQMFFKAYGQFFRKILRDFTYIFLQDENSKLLLDSINIKNSEISGDTRFDRVYEISKNLLNIELIDYFKKKSKIFIAGSTWNEDIEIIAEFINNQSAGIKTIIVPHETTEESINKIKSLITRKTIRFSELNNTNSVDYDCLIIDKIGILSSLYGYSDIAFIGGGFGKGIHNTLEAAVFGIPILFGPNYKKFKEAKDLISLNAAFCVESSSDFSSKIKKLIENEEIRIKSGQNSRIYVVENIGATNKIYEKISQNIIF